MARATDDHPASGFALSVALVLLILPAVFAVALLRVDDCLGCYGNGILYSGHDRRLGRTCDFCDGKWEEESDTADNMERGQHREILR